MKTIKRTKIVVETREVLLVSGTLVEGRCAQCGEQVEMIRLENQTNPEPDLSRARQPHLIESGDGLRFICLNSLLK